MKQYIQALSELCSAQANLLLQMVTDNPRLFEAYETELHKMNEMMADVTVLLEQLTKKA